MFSVEANGIYATRRERTFRRLFEVIKKDIEERSFKTKAATQEISRTVREACFCLDVCNMQI